MIGDGGISRVEEYADQLRRVAPRQRPAQGQPDVEPGIQHLAHVEPGPPGNVFRTLFQPGRDIQQIEAVTSEEISEMANQLFQTDKIAITVLGNLDGLKLSREHLIC